YVILVDSTHIKLASSIANAYAGVNIVLTTGGTGTQTAALYSVQIPLFQQTTVAQYSAGQGDGITNYQQFNLNDINVLTETLAVSINAASWTMTSGTQLVSYGPSSTVFR